MDKYIDSASSPYELDNPRVWRTYLGGKLLDRLHGAADPQDTHFPEEWIASTVSARNAGREEIADEGLSHFRQEPSVRLKDLIACDSAAYLGDRHVEKHGGQMGVLIKLIDSAERLSIQVHPDKKRARELFHSDYGKTECWHILGGRIVNGESPSLYIGFRPGITREKWRRLFDRQDIAGMLDCMHCFEVKKGDTFLIEGGTPHAIGAGCFLAEIQEPTDYTIRVERSTPSGLRIADSMCHQGLGFEKMMECFDYTGYTREQILKKWFIPSDPVEAQGDTVRTRIVGYRQTPMFQMDSLRISSSGHIPGSGVFSVLYVLAGEGFLTCGRQEIGLHPGRQIFLPARMTGCECHADRNMPLELLQCFGPQ